MKVMAVFEKIDGSLCSIVADDLITSITAYAGHHGVPDYVVIVRDGLRFSVKGTYGEVMVKLEKAELDHRNREAFSSLPTP